MAEVKVSLMEPRLRKVAGVNLHPGLQAISESDFAAITNHPIGASLVERGIIVERKPKAAKAEKVEAPQDKPEPPVRAADLVAEIADTFDVVRLRELSEDSRKTVSEAATEQLAKIEAL